jgi:flagellar basal body rod protein FlgG
VQRTDVVKADGVGYATVECPAGEYVTGGGFYAEGPGQVIQSSPLQVLGEQGWEAIATQQADTGVTVWAVCVP